MLYYLFNSLGFNLLQRKKRSTFITESWWAELWSPRSSPMDQLKIVTASNVPATIGGVVHDLWRSCRSVKIIVQICIYNSTCQVVVTVLLKKWSGKISWIRSNLRPPKICQVSRSHRGHNFDHYTVEGLSCPIYVSLYLIFASFCLIWKLPREDKVWRNGLSWFVNAYNANPLAQQRVGAIGS